MRRLSQSKYVGAIDYGGRRVIFASARDITGARPSRIDWSIREPRPLTDLPNVPCSWSNSEHALARGAASPEHGLFLDMDNFKILSLGHGWGPIAHKVAGRLRACGPRDTVARLAGDGVHRLARRLTNVGKATRLAGKIAEVRPSLSRSLTFRHVSIGLALGVARPQPGTCCARDADTAMYRAKKARAKWPETIRRAYRSRRLKLESDLRPGEDDSGLLLAKGT